MLQQLHRIHARMTGKNPSTRSMMMTLALVAFMATAGIGGCAMESEISGEHGLENGVEGSKHESEAETQDNVQARESGGEESGNLLTLDETYDTVRKDARLIMGYHAPDNTVVGAVENTTGGTLSQVRVDVHLSNGVELGPTAPVDLLPGQAVEVSLQATTGTFDGWTPHAEVGAGEHGAESAESVSEGEHGESGGGQDCAPVALSLARLPLKVLGAEDLVETDGPTARSRALGKPGMRNAKGVVPIPFGPNHGPVETRNSGKRHGISAGPPFTDDEDNEV